LAFFLWQLFWLLFPKIGQNFFQSSGRTSFPDALKNFSGGEFVVVGENATASIWWKSHENFFASSSPTVHQNKLERLYPNFFGLLQELTEGVHLWPYSHIY
jgi:hypothetical protein